MKRRWFLMLIAANLLVLIALVFIYPQFMVSPGPLVSGHAELSTDCFACHAPWRGTPSKLCISCHALPDIGLRTTKGVPLLKKAAKAAFHQDLMEQNCMACHSDHEAPKLTQRARKPFSHLLLRTDVRDRCDSCHVAPKNKFHSKLTAGCGDCHQTKGWKPATFDHDKLFVLDGDHDTECATCHTNNDYSRYTCYGCHEHTPEKVRSDHEEEGIRNFDNCVECHTSARDEPRKKGSRSGGEDD